MKDKYLGAGVVARLNNKAKATSAKLKAKNAAERGRRTKASQNINVKHAWDAAHIAFAKVKGRGAKAAWGFWREGQMTLAPRVKKDGTPLMRRIGGSQLPTGGFTKKGKRKFVTVGGTLQQAVKRVYRLSARTLRRCWSSPARPRTTPSASTTAP